MPSEEFGRIKKFSSGVLETDAFHYKPFGEAYVNVTTIALKVGKGKGFHFAIVSFQGVKNSWLRLLCEECDKWRLAYANKMLSKKEVKMLNTISMHSAFLVDHQAKISIWMTSFPVRGVCLRLAMW